MSSTQKNDSANTIIILLLVIAGVLIWQRNVFPAMVVYPGILICGILLFFWVRKLVRNK